MREEFESARKRLNAGETRTVGLSHESEFLSKALAQISNRKSGLEKELAETQTRYASVLQASEKKTRLREALAIKLAQIEAAMEETVSGLKELEQIKKRVAGEVQSEDKSLSMSRSRLSSLEGLMENFEGCQLGVRTIMKARDFPPGKQGRLLGVLADLIQVGPAFRKSH